MVRRKRTVVTIETEQRTVVRRRRVQIVAWCEWCRTEVLIVTPEDAGTLAQTTACEILRCVEMGGLHFAEDATGRVLVCLNSLRLPQAAVTAPGD